MQKYVEMIVKKVTPFCIISSEAGLSKTFSVCSILNGFLKKEQWVIRNSFTSPLDFYKFLVRNSEGKVIVLDDLEGVLENKIVLSILKNATELTGKRKISWNSTTTKLEECPTESEFTSSIILLTNKIPNTDKNPHIQAVINRAFFCELNFTYQDKIDVIGEVSKNEFKGINTNERKEILEFIKENTSPATKDLSIRSLIKIYHFYLFDKNSWKELALLMLSKGVSEKRKLVYELVNSNKTIKEQIKEYKNMGFSRSDYFNIKKEMFRTNKYCRIKSKSPKVLQNI